MVLCLSFFQKKYMRTPSALDWVILVALGLMWGCSFFFIKKAVQIFQPEQMTAWRMVLAWVVYMPVAAAFWSKINWKQWKPLACVAFFGSAIPNFLFAIAQQHVDSGLAGTLNSLTPLFTLLIGAGVFGMQISRPKVLGVLLGLAGAVLLIAFNSKTGLSGDVWFAALCVLATVCYAINANVANTYLRGEHPAAIASAAFMLTGWVFVAMLWWYDGWGAYHRHPDGAKGLWYLLYLAAFGTVVGSIVYYWLMARTNALFATSVTYLLPVVSLALGLLDGEGLSMIDVLGTTIILGGVYLARK
jgi:drug/metabolite transporter (DMT)-like permease